MLRYRRTDVTEEVLINEFNCIEQIHIRFQAPFGLNQKVRFRTNCLFLGQIVSFRANFFRPPSKMPSRTPMFVDVQKSST